MWRWWTASSILIVALTGCSQPQRAGLPLACGGCIDRPEPFIIVEMEVQVVVSSGPKSPEAELLAILDSVHEAQGSRGRTVVNFIDYGKLPTQRRMFANERVSLTFAQGVIDQVFGVREVKFRKIE